MIVLGILLLLLAANQVLSLIRSIINHVKILNSPEGQRLWASATGKQQENLSRSVSRTLVASVLVCLFIVAVELWAAFVVFGGV